ncbi:MAG: NAD(P)-dependent oxidoreductase [Candidatus Marinimicrobia bacterium]|nr:NAD(P)-dependent oxidoreductase [Candidatus Neomarinimicrobiota bacterium]|tara:strand:+ start:92311 stop:93057 length:747 start_codon:yes stop_codon:yes gene_type:complete
MAKNLGTVIITGGSRGIGKASVLQIAELGYDIVFTWNSSKQKAEEVLNEISSKGIRAKAIKLKLESDRIEEKFREIDRWVKKPIWGLVNNAAIDGGRTHFSERSLMEWKELFQINFFSLIEICRAAFQRMAFSEGGTGGSIVNLSSQVVTYGSNKLSAYAASKGAVNALTISMAKELGPDGIRVNAVSPGLIDTVENKSNNRYLKSKIKQLPLGRPGSAQEVAEVITWLISHKSSYVSGSIIPVHGAR